MLVKVYSGACVGVHFRALSLSEPHDSFKVNEKVTARMECDNLKIYPLLPLQFFCVICYGNKWFSAWGWLKGVFMHETKNVSFLHDLWIMVLAYAGSALSISNLVTRELGITSIWVNLNVLFIVCLFKLCLWKGTK